jgi:hypothetical protein
MTANADSGASRVSQKTPGSDGAHSINGTRDTVDAHDVDGAHSAAPTDQYRSQTPSTDGDIRHDRIRWGAVWTGALTTLAIYVVLQLLFFALGWLDLGNNGSGTTRAVVSGVLALVAFFLGGAAAGASALWHRANDGMVNAVVTWAVTVVALLGLALVGGGALVGSLADTATQFVNLRHAGAGVDVAEATRVAQQTAGWTALGLGLSMVAAALGGSIGAKLWPGRGERDAHSR